MNFWFVSFLLVFGAAHGAKYTAQSQLANATMTSCGASRVRGTQITLSLSATSADKVGFPRLPCLLASLARHAQSDSIREMLVVVPDHDHKLFAGTLEGNGEQLWTGLLSHPQDGDAIRRCLNVWTQSKFPIRVLKDSDVLPTNRELLFANVPKRERPENGGRGGGYRIQMLTKIGVAKEVHTDFYVTLDSDVYAKHPFDYGSFVAPGGRARMQGEIQSGQTQHRPSWWESSDRALDARGCVSSADPTIGVTPAVLSQKVSQVLMDRVVDVWSNQLGEGAWDLQLFRLLSRPDLKASDWTEYTLHYVAACQAGLRDSYFETHGNFSQPPLYEYSQWNWGSFSKSTLEKEDGHGSVFGVVQSISGASPADVNNALADLIAGKKTST